MPEPSIVIATSHHRDRVVTTVVTAFRSDPAFGFFFPEDYERQASAFAGLLFDNRVATAATWVADGGAAVAMWDRPRPVEAGREDDLEGRLTDRLDPGALDRVLRYEAAVDAALPREPHWYLGILATDPDHAGRRLGRSVMRSGLVEAGRAGVPAALETTNPTNVTRYEGEGWRVTGEVEVDRLTVWVLRHEGVG